MAPLVMRFPGIRGKSYGNRMVQFALLVILMFSTLAIPLIFHATAGAASYTASNMPPQCTDFTANYTIREMIEASNNNAARANMLAAYDNGAPFVLVAKDTPTNEDRPRRWAITVWEYFAASTPSVGVRMPSDSTQTTQFNVGTTDKMRWQVYGDFEPDNLTVLRKSTSTYATTATAQSSTANRYSVSNIYSWGLDDSFDGDCVVAVRNVAMIGDLGYIGADEFEDNIVDKEENFWSSVTGALGNIVDFIAGLPEFIVSLFVPNGSTISSQANELMDFFSEKFGFLIWPFEFMISLFQNFIFWGGSDYEGVQERNVYNLSCDSYPMTSNWNFGEFFGGHVFFSPHAMKCTMGPLWDWLLIAARGMFVLALIGAFHHRWRTIVEHKNA